jgi:hypothetical protein
MEDEKNVQSAGTVQETGDIQEALPHNRGVEGGRKGRKSPGVERGFEKGLKKPSASRWQGELRRKGVQSTVSIQETKAVQENADVQDSREFREADSLQELRKSKAAVSVDEVQNLQSTVAVRETKETEQLVSAE